MNYVVDKVNTIFRDKKAYFFIVLMMFCLGISFGLYTVKYIGESDKNDLMSYLNSFTTSIQGQPINYTQLLFEVIKKSLILFIPIIFLGMTFFGFPFILILDLIKGFTLGYTFSFISSAFNGKGLLFGIISILPQNIIYIPCFIALSVICLNMSAEKFKEKVFKSSKAKDVFLRDTLSRLIIIMILFLLGILIETYVSPSIIKFVANKFLI